MSSLLVVGSVALDTITTPAGSVEEVLGGSATFFSLSARFFSDVRVVAVVGEDFPERHVRLLAERGVDLKGLQRAPGRTFRWSGEYQQDLNTAITRETQLNVFERFDPQIPEEWRRTPYVFLANIDPDLQRQVLLQIERPRFVGLDTMNYWIHSKPDSLRRTISMVDMVTFNDAEARMLTGEKNLLKASRQIMELGPRVVVIKRGEYGALLFTKSGYFVAHALLLEDIVDPTGAGDTFAGGLLGTIAGEDRAEEPTLRRGIVHGSVLASFTVEGFGTGKLARVRVEEIAGRLDDFAVSRTYDGLPIPDRAAGA
jgi:sugar/nucleoside kinase (ribokinase family)